MIRPSALDHARSSYLKPATGPKKPNWICRRRTMDSNRTACKAVEGRVGAYTSYVTSTLTCLSMLLGYSLTMQQDLGMQDPENVLRQDPNRDFALHMLSLAIVHPRTPPLRRPPSSHPSSSPRSLVHTLNPPSPSSTITTTQQSAAKTSSWSLASWLFLSTVTAYLEGTTSCRVPPQSWAGAAIVACRLLRPDTPQSLLCCSTLFHSQDSQSSIEHDGYVFDEYIVC